MFPLILAPFIDQMDSPVARGGHWVLNDPKSNFESAPNSVKIGTLVNFRTQITIKTFPGYLLS